MLAQLGHALQGADAATVVGILAEDVTLHVAVHDEPICGRPAASHVLSAVLAGALHDIEVTETTEGPGPSVLMFSARVADHPGRATGLLVVRPDEDSRISDLTVFLRPLSALQALAEEMGRRLGSIRPDGNP